MTLATLRARNKKRIAEQKRIAKIFRHQRTFAIKLATMMAEAGQLKLYATQHKLHAAVQKVGWEIAEQAEKMVEKTVEKKRERKCKNWPKCSCILQGKENIDCKVERYVY